MIPEDVRAVCHDVLRHRIGLTYEAEANNITADEIISEILDKVEVPDCSAPYPIYSKLPLWMQKNFLAKYAA